MNAHVRSSAALNLRTHSLIAFVLQPVEPLVAWLEMLDGWLSRSPNFFAEKPILLDMARADISLKDYRDLLSQLARRHIRVMGVEGASRSLVGPHLPPNVTGGRPVDQSEAPAESKAPADGQPPAAELPPGARSRTLIIDAPVRSGQTISNFEGDITIVGRVASGAEIIAGGSVHVYGSVQGRIIAGVSGAPDARIFCTEARAELLCIGGAYATAEEMDPKTEGKSLEIRLAEGQLNIKILN
jgi:septum site-determining protein MinC